MIITDEKQIASIMNECFVSIIEKLSLKAGIPSRDSDSDFFHNYISTKKINEFYPEIVSNSFKSQPVTKYNVKMKYRNSMEKNLSRFDCIPVKILKDCIDVYLVR